MSVQLAGDDEDEMMDAPVVMGNESLVTKQDGAWNVGVAGLGVDWVVFQDRYDWFLLENGTKADAKKRGTSDLSDDESMSTSSDEGDIDGHVGMMKDLGPFPTDGLIQPPPSKRSRSSDDDPVSTTAAADAELEKTVVYPALVEGFYYGNYGGGFRALPGRSTATGGLGDEYGEAIHPADYKKVTYQIVDDGSTQVLAGDLNGATPATMMVDVHGGSAADHQQASLADPVQPPQSEEALDDFATETPSKLSVTTQTITVRTPLLFFDFSGLPTSKSLKTLLQTLLPKKIVLVGGDEKGTGGLFEFAKGDEKVSDDVYVAKSSCLSSAVIKNKHDASTEGIVQCEFKLGEWMNVSSSMGMFRVRLVEGLGASVKFERMGEYELGYVQGEITYPQQQPPQAGDDAHGKDKKDEQVGSGLASLDAVKDDLKTGLSHPSIIIGDLKLTELRKALAQRGIQSDFERGQLVVSTTIKSLVTGAAVPTGGEGDPDQVSAEVREVRVSKDPDGALVVEGSYGRTFWKVRKVIYSLHTRI